MKKARTVSFLVLLVAVSGCNFRQSFCKNGVAQIVDPIRESIAVVNAVPTGTLPSEEDCKALAYYLGGFHDLSKKADQFVQKTYVTTKCLSKNSSGACTEFKTDIRDQEGYLRTGAMGAALETAVSVAEEVCTLRDIEAEDEYKLGLVSYFKDVVLPEALTRYEESRKHECSGS
jgi:hypothetical protein